MLGKIWRRLKPQGKVSMAGHVFQLREENGQSHLGDWGALDKFRDQKTDQEQWEKVIQG